MHDCVAICAAGNRDDMNIAITLFRKELQYAPIARQ